jgi:hypothetical protein
LVCIRPFTYVHSCSHTFTSVHFCSHLFTSFHICSHTFTSVHIRSLFFTSMLPKPRQASSYLLPSPRVSPHMLLLLLLLVVVVVDLKVAGQTVAFRGRVPPSAVAPAATVSMSYVQRPHSSRITCDMPPPEFFIDNFCRTQKTQKHST